MSVNLKDPTGSPHDGTNDAASAMCGRGVWDKYPIFRIHVAKNSLSDYYIRLWLMNTPDASPVDVPFTAFLQGHTYDMWLKKYTIVNGSGTEITGSDASFILVGYYAASMPFEIF